MEICSPGQTNSRTFPDQVVHEVWQIRLILACREMDLYISLLSLGKSYVKEIGLDKVVELGYDDIIIIEVMEKEIGHEDATR